MTSSMLSNAAYSRGWIDFMSPSFASRVWRSLAEPSLTNGLIARMSRYATSRRLASLSLGVSQSFIQVARNKRLESLAGDAIDPVL